jgi:hypothetical protein
MRNFIKYSFLILIVAMACRKDEVVNDRVTPDNFLSDKKYEKLIVEIQYVSGYAPTAETVENLRTFLQQRLNKSGGITIVQNEIASPGKLSYSIDDIKNIEYANRSQNTNKKTLTAYFFFADGHYAGNSGSSKVLGIAYGGSSMVIFEETIKEYSGGVTQPAVSTLETTVVNHEFGHILGLVNNGTSMHVAHQDSANGRHCDNQNCLMYYTAETSDIVANLLGSGIPGLDANCINDLRVNGGK